MYRTDVYFLCKMLAEFPLYILFPLVSFAIPYYAIGLNPGVDRFFIGSAIVILVTNVAVSFGNYQLGINLNIKNKASPLISVNL